MNQGRYTSRNAAYWRDRPAIIFGDRTVSFGELDTRSNRLANALLGLGLAKGDRVAVQAWNCPEIIELECALYKAGLVKVALNARLSSREVVDTVNNAQASVFIVDPAHSEEVAAVRQELDSVRHMIVTGVDSVAGWRPYESFIAAGADRNPDVEMAESDLAVLHFTSGSTGKLKAAMQTVGNRMASLRKVVMGRMRANPGEVLALAGPITHASGMFMQPFLFQGGTILLHDRFDPEAFLASAERHRAAFSFMVPTMINMLIAEPSLRRRDLGALRQISYGGAPMAPARVREAWEALGPKLSQGYGTGETTGGLALLSTADHAHALAARPERLSSCGRLFGEGELRLVDEQGQPVGCGEVGEITVRGPDVFAGYWGELELSAQALRDGWLHTGDLARMDDEGFVYIVDRKKDMIISGGENIYCAEVENVLFEHPQIREAAVIGRADDRWGEVPVAIVALTGAESLTLTELEPFLNERLARYKHPKDLVLVEELPRNASGKVIKPLLRKTYS